MHATESLEPVSAICLDACDRGAAFWQYSPMALDIRGGLRLIAVASAMAVVSACAGTTAELPDRADAAVQAAETHLAEVIGADASILGAPGTCSVRLLRQTEEAAFVWAHCETSTPVNTAVSAPMRVVGSQVTVPRDGSQYTKDIRAIFPDDLAETVLKHDASTRP